MTPLSAPDASTSLVARILQPLARSLAEARHHLDLEAADDTPADDDAITGPDAPPAFAPRRHDRPHEPARSAATAIPLPAIPRAAAPHAAAGADVPSAEQAAVRPAGHRSIERRGDASPPTSPAWHGTASPGSRAPSPPPDEPATDVGVAPVANRNADSPAPAPTRSGAVAAGLRVARPPATVPDSAPAPAAGVQLHRTGSPLRTIGAARTQPDHPSTATATDADRARPSPPSAPQHHASAAAVHQAVASHTGTPDPAAPAPGEPRPTPVTRPPRNWRLRPTPLGAVEPSSNPPPGESSEQAAGHPAAPQPAAPSLLPRNPALTRVMQAMDPVLERAWQLTDTALQPAADTPPAPAADAPAPRVANHFHVNVALGSDTAAGRDPQQLQDALAALLRDAARRQGLDV